MLNSVVDNDVIEKLCRWESLSVISDCLELELSAVGYLGSLRFVIGKKFVGEKYSGATEDLKAFLHAASELVPTEAELHLAASLQEFPLPKGMTMDEGESILFSAAILRTLDRVLTGDKRAICGCAQIAKDAAEIATLKGRLMSLEQILGTMIEVLGQDQVRKRVCSDAKADKTAAICFSCGTENLSEGTAAQALLSYQSDLATKSDGFSSKTLGCSP
ncbi:hypothetical protein [Roseobacter weihaiensis]|uniref:hypothetical protein n=1 Tax=Roseobacter weihaiensis TaxID=2763262 RepID=UPI001D0B0F0F|nr:hypothetical protein [Roseobacter sp. H9]